MVTSLIDYDIDISFLFGNVILIFEVPSEVDDCNSCEFLSHVTQALPLSP